MEHTTNSASCFLVALVGASYLLSGYRMVRFTSKVGAAMCAVFLALLGAQYLKNGWAVAGIVTAAAIAGFFLGNAYYYIHMAAVGAFMGVLMMAFVAAAAGGHIDWGSGIASGILGAMLVCRFERPVVIFATSLIGGATFFGAANTLGMQMPTVGPVLLMVAMTVLGCVVQAKTTKRSPANRPAPRGSCVTK
jgi:hypothetical protein